MAQGRQIQMEQSGQHGRPERGECGLGQPPPHGGRLGWPGQQEHPTRPHPVSNGALCLQAQSGGWSGGRRWSCCQMSPTLASPH